MGRPALLFDLDGTMLETDPIHRAVFAELMAPEGIDVTEDYYAQNVHGRLNVDYFAEVFPDRDAHTWQAMSDAKEAQFRDRLPRPYPAMPGAAELVARADEAGWEKAIVTNAMRLNAEAMLEAIGLRHRFDLIVSGEECAQGKPAPDPYLVAMEALGATPQTAIAFEDSPSGLASARASGAYTVGIASALTPTQLREHGAQAVMRDFTDPALALILGRLEGIAT